MPVANMAYDRNQSRDLFPGALEMMILESLRRAAGPRICAGAAHPAAVKQPASSRRGFALSRAAATAESEAGEGGVGTLSTNRRVRTYQITAAGLRRLEQQISSFERMFEGISLVLNPGKATTN